MNSPVVWSLVEFGKPRFTLGIPLLFLVLALVPGTSKSVTGQDESKRIAIDGKGTLDSTPQQLKKKTTDSQQAIPQEPIISQEIELPWERKRENKIPRLTKLNERELLADITEEELLSVHDHLPISLNQHLFAKLLFRVPQFGLDNLAWLAEKNSKTDLVNLENEPGFHRFRVFRVQGKARFWERRKLDNEVGELFDLSLYYKLKIQTRNNENIIVYCHSIPDAWKKNQEVLEDINFEGLYVNLTLSKEKTPVLNFIADRVRWVPKSETGLVNGKGHALLGSAGFDLGLLDVLKTRNKRRIDNSDTEAFYQMLAAARLISKSENTGNWQNGVPRFNLVETLKSPAQFHGDLTLVGVEVRNVTRIKVEQEYIKNRVGIQEYFQLDGFVKFDSTVTYKGENGQQGAVFKEKYPVCVCVNRLPSGWETGSGQHYKATFPAFFFKIWAFPSGYQNKFSSDSLQQSPLLIALDPMTVGPVQNSVNWTRVGLFVLFGFGFISIWTMYCLGKVKKEKNATQFRMPSKVDDENIPEVNPDPEQGQPVVGMPVIKE